MQELRFPTYASQSARLLIWTPDQVIPAATMFGVGIVTGMLTYTVPVGLLLSWAYTKYSAGKPDGYLIHKAYWLGLYSISARSAINPFLRKVLPK